MSIANGTWNEQDEKGIRTSTEIRVFLGRETLKRAGRVAEAKGIPLGGYIASIVRSGVNIDFEVLRHQERSW